MRSARVIVRSVSSGVVRVLWPVIVGGSFAKAGSTGNVARRQRKSAENIKILVFIWSLSGSLYRVARMPREDTFEHAGSGFFAMARHGFFSNIVRGF